MKKAYLEVTYRLGRPLAAYLYLPRPAGAKSVRTEEAEPGLLVDYASNGVPIGLEITAPRDVSVDTVNSVLERMGLSRIAPEELAPLHAA